MPLEEAINTTLKLSMTDDVRNAIQNYKTEIVFTYYDATQMK